MSILPTHAFLPVVHAVDSEQTMRNVRIAFQNGAHGVFLINHTISAERLLALYAQVRCVFPHHWIGLNFLDLQPEQALTIVPRDAQALWVDSIGFDPTSANPVARAQRYAQMRRPSATHWRGLFFGGVAFKYQPNSGDAAEEARLVAPLVDVVTTSGSATGFAPSVTKIRTMREAIPTKKPLAIASGMTPENVAKFYAFANYFLVATGINDSETELNPVRVRQFADIVRE